MHAPAPPLPETRKVALLIACASILQCVESLIPQPFPGIRLGMANAVTLVALADLGAAASIQVAVFRSIVASFVLGTFLSPTFILSFSAAVTSSVAMALVYRLLSRASCPPLSLVGISLAGSLVHNLTQISLVSALFIRHSGVFLLLPWLGLSAVGMGWITGLIACHACRRLQSGSAPVPGPGAAPVGTRPSVLRSGVPSAGYEPGHSPIHRLPSPLKILLTFVLAVLMLVPNGSIPFLLATLLLCAAAAVGGVFSSRWFAPLRRLVLFLAFSFAVPVVFTQTGHVYWDLGPWSLTSDGVAHGTRAVWRVVLLALGVSLLVRTTAPDELTRGLQKILAPLRVLRIDVQRTAAIVSLSWSLIPVVWERAQTCILSRRSRQSKWRDAVPALGDTIAALYCLRDDGAEIAAPDAHAACPVFAGQKERKDHP